MCGGKNRSEWKYFNNFAVQLQPGYCVDFVICMPNAAETRQVKKAKNNKLRIIKNGKEMRVANKQHETWKSSELLPEESENSGRWWCKWKARMRFSLVLVLKKEIFFNHIYDLSTRKCPQAILLFTSFINIHFLIAFLFLWPKGWHVFHH